MRDDQQREAAAKAICGGNGFLWETRSPFERMHYLREADSALAGLSALARMQPDPLRAGVEAFLVQYASARPLRCGVCSGHSPSWDGHSGCQAAAVDRLRALLAETEVQP